METGTFLRENVKDYVNKYFIPLKYESGRDAEQFLRFAVTATPTFLVLNTEGDEIYRTVGYSGADDFINHLEKSRARIH